MYKKQCGNYGISNSFEDFWTEINQSEVMCKMFIPPFRLEN